MIFMGTAKIDITPEYPVPLAGFAARNNRPFEGISEKIYVRIAFLRQQDPEGEVTNAVLVSADLLWWGSDRIGEIRQKLQSDWGLKEENILLHATHTHSGPQTSHRYHPIIGMADTGYIRRLETSLFSGIGEAVRNLEEVRIEHGCGSCGLNVNRRLIAGGRVELRPNPEGPVDSEIQVVRFLTGDRRVKALFVHYACHPVLLYGMQVSPDFPGFAMNLLEQDGDPGMTAIYLQGCCGDINPNPPEGNRDAARFAGMFAESVREVLSGPMKAVTESRLGGRTYRLPLAFGELPSREDLAEASLHGESPLKEWASWFLEDENRLHEQAVLEMTHFRMGDELSLFTFNAEMVVFYGHYLKKLSSGAVLPLCYTNGTIGYVTTAEQLVEGGYEPAGSIPYFYLPASFSHSNEETILGLLQDVAGKPL